MMDNLDQVLANRIRLLREARRWSLAELGNASGVSKAMLSRIERAEASPTATTLSRIASAFGFTLAELLTFDKGPGVRLLRRVEQREWRDPVSLYARRQILADADVPLELVEVVMPPGGQASFPATSYVGRRHIIWVLCGQLSITEGVDEWQLESGDRLVFGEPAPVTYANRGTEPCRYLVCVLRG